MSGSQHELLAVMQYHGCNVAFQEMNGIMMINVTQMGKPFRKTPKDWLRTQQAQDLIKTVSIRHKCLLTDLQKVVNGGKNPGTWFQKDVALFFAQWLSPDFYLACNEKLIELLADKALNLPSINGVALMASAGKFGYPRKPMLVSVGRSFRNGYRLRYRFPKECFNIGNTACISPKLANYLVQEQKLRDAQLSLFHNQYLGDAL